jgi:hypothetical protein
MGLNSPSAHGKRGHESDAHGPSDLAGHELDDRSSRDGLRTWQVPGAADGSLIGAEGGEAVRDVGNIAVGMG